MAADISQIMVVTKNEMIKCVRGKKFLVSLLIVLLVFILITALQFVTKNWDSMNNIANLVDVYFDTLPVVITLIVALLSSIAIVSEFEERTALILFTRPVRRTSILLGKILSCTIIEAAIILAYYILVCIVGIAKIGEIPFEFITSFGFAVLYAFAASGVAFIISSFFRKGSVCTVISILLLVLVFPLVSTMMSTNDGENWYMIDQAGDTIYTCVPEYVDNYNKSLIRFDEVVDNAAEILSGYVNSSTASGKQGLDTVVFAETFHELSEEMQQAVVAAVQKTGSVPADYEMYFTSEFMDLSDSDRKSLVGLYAFLSMGADKNIPEMIVVLRFMTNMSILKPIDYPDLVKNAAVLIIWGLVCYLIAWARFVRREF